MTDGDDLPEFEDLPREAVVTKADHLEDQIQQLRSTVAILKSLAGVERPVDEVGELFTTETCNTDDDWEYLLALVGEAAREDIDDPYERAAYVVDRWYYKLLYEPEAPNGSSYEFITDGGHATGNLVFQDVGDSEWHIFDEETGDSLCGEHELDDASKTLEFWGEGDTYEESRDCRECCQIAGIVDEPPVATDGGTVEVCPECHTVEFFTRGGQMRSRKENSGQRFICKCGARFDEPDERPREVEYNNHNISDAGRKLLEADPDDVATDGGHEDAAPPVDVGDRVTATFTTDGESEYVEAIVTTVHSETTIDAVYRVESRLEHGGDGDFERDHHTDRYEFQTSLVYMSDVAGWLKGWDDA